MINSSPRHLLSPLARGVLFAVMVSSLLVGSLPAAAELVVLNDGRFFKARVFELEGERAHLTLARGGALTLPLSRIERVVDDEVPLPEIVPVPEAQPPAAISPAFAWRFADDHPVPTIPYGKLIYETAQRHQLNPALVAAVVRAESAYNPAAVSHAGARGLMQLMPATARRFGVAQWEIHEPARNLDAGATYLRWLIGRFDEDLRLALAAYNAGEGTVDRYAGVPPFRETRGYVKKIFGFLGIEVAQTASVTGSAAAEPSRLARAAGR